MSFQNCVGCHFFVKEARGLPNGPATLEVTEDERRRSRADDFGWHEPHYAIACHFGVWDQGHNFDSALRYSVLVERNRHHYCFFWQYRPGMLLPAARILQEREAQEAASSRDRRLTIWGLWIAALAIVADVLVQVFR